MGKPERKVAFLMRQCRRHDDLILFSFEFGFGFFARFGDEKVTGFLADHGDGGFVASVADDAFKAGGC